MGDDDALNVIHRAERIVYAASWRVQEETVLQLLAGTRGLAYGRLEPRSEVIQLVTYDGQHLGHIRRETQPRPERWVAVLKDQAKTVGLFPSPQAAAEALVQAAGNRTPKAGLCGRQGPVTVFDIEIPQHGGPKWPITRKR